MPSDFLTPFLELEEEFFMTRGPDLASSVDPQLQLRAAAFQRRHSHCPNTQPKCNSSEVEGPWGLTLGPQQRWSRELPRSALSHIPFRVDRSVSMIDTPHLSTRYKTELCRTYEESGACKYGAKCQFAHGSEELRGLSRHPKYKTEPCRTFHTIGFCPYGARCHFIHNADELCSGALQKPRAPKLRHSISFSGFSSASHFQPVEEAPAPRLYGRASSVSPSPQSAGSPDCPSPLFPEPGALRHYSFPLSALLDLGDDWALQFSAVPEHVPALSGALSGALRRCSSADCVCEEDYASSVSTGPESPEGHRLSIFSQMSLTEQEADPGLDQD